MISGRLLDCVDYVEKFGAIGPPVSLLPLYPSLQERALKLSTPPSCRDHTMAQALNIEGIDSSLVLLVAGSGLAEPGVDILVQQWVYKLGRVGNLWELTTFESEAKERIRRVGFVLFREKPTTPNHLATPDSSLGGELLGLGPGRPYRLGVDGTLMDGQTRGVPGGATLSGVPCFEMDWRDSLEIWQRPG
ncbi:hypothetical protein FPCIR_12265 [Fusarium pseudocircinatum]|uniref:Uncharacterized protein n=1 Tax=Fusarium pseudocircinatum TaxID=56676 RepID=A0A8H5NS45_9HYPO|nr:hypothetical protein FPCIR_12265 [Fusarium pseudocircinatum]